MKKTAKSGGLGMALHQSVSFSGALMGLSRARAVFWPGCALMSLGPDLLNRTLAILRRTEPGMGLSSCCCGQPTRYLQPERFPKRQDKLRALLEGHDVERVYTACPNCTLQLKELGSFEIIPIWPLLAEVISPDDLVPVSGRYVLHDPCPMRQDREGQDAVRSLLSLTGMRLWEPEHNRENTLCCGNIQMLRATAPEKSAAIRARRLAEFPEDMGITSCCEGCLEAFRTEGRSTAHVLELLFGLSARRGWGARLAYTRQVKRKEGNRHGR